MRDIFDRDFREPAARSDGVGAAQHAAAACASGSTRAASGRRAGEGGFAILLDGKPVRTPGAPPAGRAVAARWPRRSPPNGRRSARSIDPAQMPLTRLANAIIDGVADAPQPVAAEIEKYLGSDLLFYRAGRAGRPGRAPGAALGPGARTGRARRSARASCWRRA